ncbi:LytTR family transcriptional regulator [Mycoplasmatota bacterium]|nr:LytTR family transcriptional regulator [Mycoplasmatota bacterium]
MIIVGKKHRGSHEVEADDVIYFESDNNDVFLVGSFGKLKTDFKLYELEKTLADSKFIQISKSHIINITKIIGVSQQWNSRIKLKVVNDISLYVNRTYIKQFKKYIRKGVE